MLVGFRLGSGAMRLPYLGSCGEYADMYLGSENSIPFYQEYPISMDSTVTESWKRQFRFQRSPEFPGSDLKFNPNGTSRYTFEEWEQTATMGCVCGEAHRRSRILSSLFHLRHTPLEASLKFIRSEVCPKVIRVHAEAVPGIMDSNSRGPVAHRRIVTNLQMAMDDLYHQMRGQLSPIQLFLSTRNSFAPSPFKDIMLLEEERENRLLDFLSNGSETATLKQMYPDILQIQAVDAVYAKNHSDEFVLGTLPELPTTAKTIQSDFQRGVVDLLASLPLDRAVAAIHLRPNWLRLQNVPEIVRFS